MLCDSIGIDARPNNGTMRLPLKPVGLHNVTPVEEPADPVSAYSKDPVPGATQPTIGATVGVDPVDKKPTTATTTSSALSSGQPAASPTSSSVPVGGSDKNPLNKVANAANDFWNWLTDKVGEAWDKIKGNSGETTAP